MAGIVYESGGVQDHQLDPLTRYYLECQRDRHLVEGVVLEHDRYVPITAIVNNLADWRAQPSVRVGVDIPLGQERHFVTARVPLSRVEVMSELRFVTSLKVARVVRPLLANTKREVGLQPSQISAELLSHGGEGVVVGVVDYGGDFVHQRFRKTDGSTRIRAIWNQYGNSGTGPYQYGDLHEEGEINHALQQSDPYAALSYPVGHESHGTHVMDIAAGNEGVAPLADLAFVHVASWATRGRDSVLKSDFGDTVQVIEAVKYLFELAGDQPCVVNLSLGTNGGPHDGTNPVEVALDAMVNAKPNRAITIAAANSYEHKIHKTGKVPQGGVETIEWEIRRNDRTHNEMEIWYSKDDEFEVDIIDARGNRLASRVALNERGNFYIYVNGTRQSVGLVVHQKHDPDSGDNVIHIFHDPLADPNRSDWTVQIHGKKIHGDGTYHAWIERDVYYYHSHIKHDDPEFTLGSLSSGHKTIVVGSYDATSPSTPLSDFSSSGPTRDGRYKPEVSAPGQDVVAASSTTGTGVVAKPGTSMAAPAVAGLIARIFSVAQARGITLSIDQTRQILFDTARKTPTHGHSADWHPRYGYGRISAAALKHPLLQKT